MMTPVEWLFDKLWDTPKDKFEWYALREQALKIEKERIKEARQDGIDSDIKGYSIPYFIMAKTSTKYHSEINPKCKCHGGYCYRTLEDGSITNICGKTFKEDL